MYSTARIAAALVVCAAMLLATAIASAEGSGTLSMIRVSIAHYGAIEYGGG